MENVTLYTERRQQGFEFETAPNNKRSSRLGSVVKFFQMRTAPSLVYFFFLCVGLIDKLRRRSLFISKRLDY